VDHPLWNKGELFEINGRRSFPQKSSTIKEKQMEISELKNMLCKIKIF
jgi:hypothetical protein